MYKVFFLIGIIFSASHSYSKAIYDRSIYTEFIKESSELNESLLLRLSSQLITVDRYDDFLKSERRRLTLEYRKNVFSRYKVYSPQFKRLNISHFKKIQKLDRLLTSQDKNFIWEKKGTTKKNKLFIITANSTTRNINNILNIIKKIEYLKTNYNIRIILNGEQDLKNLAMMSHLQKYKREYDSKDSVIVLNLNIVKTKERQNIITLVKTISNKKFLLLEKTITKNLFPKSILKKYNYRLESVNEINKPSTCSQFKQSEISCMTVEYFGIKSIDHNKFVKFITEVISRYGLLKSPEKAI